MESQSHTNRTRRLSVLVIARNEEQVLGATIQSVRAIADEILVLDTGSIDQTALVAEAAGAVVSRAEWEDDFSAARNRLMDQATGDWILWIDAGEQLTPETAQDLRNFIDQNPDPQRVYLMMVRTPPANPGVSAEQAAQPRLLPRRADLRFHGRICETLRLSMEAAGLRIDAAPGRITRDVCLHDPKRKTLKALRDLKLVALETAGTVSAPESRLLNALGEALSCLNDQAAAHRAFLQAVKHAPRGSTEMLEGYYGLLTTFSEEPPGQDRRLEVFLEALDLYPLDAQLLCAMGSHLQSRNRLDLAARAFRTAFTHGTVDLKTWHLCEIAEVAAICLGLVLQLQGKDDEACHVLEEALDRCAGSSRIRRRLVDLHVKKGQEQEAIRLVNAMPLEAQSLELLRDVVRGASKAARQEWQPALGLLQGAYVSGCRDPLCLRWLAVTLLSNGQTEGAEPILRQWLQLEPDNAEARTYLGALIQEDTRHVSQFVDPAGSTEARWLRIDPATTVMDVAPAHVPIVHQASSSD